MTTQFYEKVGNRYKPVSVYDSRLQVSFREGCHLVICEKGRTLYKHSIDPNYAALIAAAELFNDSFCSAVIKKSVLPAQTTLTDEQRKAYEAFVDTIPDDDPFRGFLRVSSVREAAEEGSKVLMHEANKLLNNPAVRNAFENFLFLCRLTEKEPDETSSS